MYPGMYLGFRLVSADHNRCMGHYVTLPSTCDRCVALKANCLLQKGKKLAEAGEGPSKKLPRWKVFEVRALEEALLQHGEDRTATTRKAVRYLCSDLQGMLQLVWTLTEVGCPRT